MKKIFFLFGIVVASCVFAQNEPDMCSSEMTLANFPPPYVKKTLKEFGVPEKDWDKIVTKLQQLDPTVAEKVQEIAEKQKENPLKDPKLRDQAVAIMRNVLLEVFTEAAKEGGVTDPQKITEMLKSIHEQKRKQFSMCLERFQPEDGVSE
jgi:hypothetical protein